MRWYIEPGEKRVRSVVVQGKNSRRIPYLCPSHNEISGEDCDARRCPNSAWGVRMTMAAVIGLYLRCYWTLPQMLLDSTSIDKEREKEVSRLQEISGQPFLDATHRQLTQGWHTEGTAGTESTFSGDRGKLIVPVEESSRVPSEGPSTSVRM